MVKFDLCNTGSEPTPGPFTTSLFLSTNDALSNDAEHLQSFIVDDVLQPAECYVRANGKNPKLKGKGLEDPTGKFAIVVIDFGNEIENESNEQNNILVQLVE